MRRADVIAVALLCLGLVTACSDIDASSSSGSSGNTASGSVRSMSPLGSPGSRPFAVENALA